MMLPFAFLGLGMPEMLAIGGIALLLFGARRLPELARSLGKGIVEFKKGVKGLEDDVDVGTTVKGEPAAELPRPPQRVTAPSPRFEEQADKAAPPH